MKRLVRAGLAVFVGIVLGLGGVVLASGSGGPWSTGPAGSSVRVSSPQVAPHVAPANITPTFVPKPETSTFTPIAPCRLVDTRSSHILRPGVVRSFVVTGATSLSGQGGSSSGCGIPATASAVSATLTTSSETANGRLLAGSTAGPLATTISYQKHVPITAPATLMLSGTAGQSNISVKASAGKIQLWVSVNGYYSSQIHLIILADGTVWYGTNHLCPSPIPRVPGHTPWVSIDRSTGATCSLQAMTRRLSRLLAAGEAPQ